MDKIVQSIGLASTSSGGQPVTTDNICFRITSKWTVILLVILDIMLTSREIQVGRIKCIGGGGEDSSGHRLHPGMSKKIQEEVEFYFETRGKYSFSPFRKPQDPNDENDPFTENEETVNAQNYYHWVNWMLFLHATLLFIPRFLWSTCEGGRLHALTEQLNSLVLQEEREKRRKLRLLVEYLSKNQGKHKDYALPFFICETLNFINIVAQFFLMDRFLGSKFRGYGQRIVMGESGRENSYNNRELFPEVLVFKNFQFGQNFKNPPLPPVDALCNLPLNTFNQMAFLILWFWLILGIIISGLSLVYRLLILITPKFREFILRLKAKGGDLEDIISLTMELESSDWFLLYQIGRNTNPIIFQGILKDFAKRMRSKGVRFQHSEESV